VNNDQGAGRMARRFRGFLPVVVDVETGGFNCQRDALLQIAAVMIDLDDAGRLVRGAPHSYHVKPFEGANIEAASLQVNKIDPWHPLRPALEEREVLQRIFREVRAGMQSAGCKRAILVGHNAWFDLSFLNAAVERSGVKRCPFHPFSSFDTATLAGAALDKLSSQRQPPSPDWAGTAHRHIQRATTPNAPPNCSARYATNWPAALSGPKAAHRSWLV
jgi:ribonuclease T